MPLTCTRCKHPASTHEHYPVHGVTRTHCFVDDCPCTAFGHAPLRTLLAGLRRLTSAGRR
jgi:hypothetical protein